MKNKIYGIKNENGQWMSQNGNMMQRGKVSRAWHGSRENALKIISMLPDPNIFPAVLPIAKG